MVVGDLVAVVEHHDIATLVDPHHARVANPDVLRVAEDRSNGVRDVRGLETGRGHLVQQRQKSVKVVSIDDGDANRLVRELSCRGQTREAAADHHDVRQGAHLLIRELHAR